MKVLPEEKMILMKKSISRKSQLKIGQRVLHYYKTYIMGLQDPRSPSELHS